MIARCEDVEDLAIYERLAHVNYLAAAYCTHAALPALLASGGRILAVASVSGLTGVPTRTAYAASKHAMVGFFESLRIELRNRGVSVTIAAPDYVSTRIHERALTADGSELGYSPLRHEHALAAAKCADLLVSAMLSRRRLVLTSFRSRIGRWLRLIAPRLVDRMAARAAVRWR